MGFYKSNTKEKEKEFTVEVKADYGTISPKGTKEPAIFRLVSYNGNDPKYEIRRTYTDKDGNVKTGRKGLTMTGEEVENLLKLLQGIADAPEETEKPKKRTPKAKAQPKKGE